MSIAIVNFSNYNSKTIVSFHSALHARKTRLKIFRKAELQMAKIRAAYLI